LRPPANASKIATGGLLKRLPRLSTSVWLIIVGALFLIAILPIALSFSDEIYRQSALNNRLVELGTQYNDLQGQLTAQTSVDSEISKLSADIAAQRAIYGSACDSIETAQKLINLAGQYDITITSMSISSATAQIQGTDYPVTIYALGMNGWIQNFLNFIRDLDHVLPSSIATDITMQPAQAQGAPDQATITVTVYCTNQ
jgi:hypothetical protein